MPRPVAVWSPLRFLTVRETGSSRRVGQDEMPTRRRSRDIRHAIVVDGIDNVIDGVRRREINVRRMSGPIGNLNGPQLHSLIAVECIQECWRRKSAACGNRDGPGSNRLRGRVGETLREGHLARGKLKRLELVGAWRRATRCRHAELVGVRRLDLVSLESRSRSQRLQRRGQRREICRQRCIVFLLRLLARNLVVDIGYLKLLACLELGDQVLIVDTADRPDRRLNVPNSTARA